MIRSDFFLAIGWVVYAGARRTVVVGGGRFGAFGFYFIHSCCMHATYLYQMVFQTSGESIYTTLSADDRRKAEMRKFWQKCRSPMTGRMTERLKGTAHLKMRSQSLSPHSNADRKSGRVS